MRDGSVASHKKSEDVSKFGVYKTIYMQPVQ
jgi:hypothetical protein